MLPHLRNLLAASVGFVVMTGLCIILHRALWLTLDAPLPFMPVLLDDLLFWQPDRVDYNRVLHDGLFSSRQTTGDWLRESAGSFVLWGLPIGIVAGCAGGFVLKKMMYDSWVVGFMLPLWPIGGLACFVVYPVLGAWPVGLMVWMWIGVMGTGLASGHLNPVEMPCLKDFEGGSSDSPAPGDGSD